ncbi:MAG: L-threonate dehydrogenase, partial [Acetobacteraceae bacterium]
MRVAAIGLGSMGLGAARNLLKAGLDVVGVDPRAEAREAFAGIGGRAVARAADIDPDTEAVLVLVVTAAQTEAALFGEGGAAARLAPGAVVISSATMSPEAARALAAKAEASGLLYLDAPVSGGARGAAEGAMVVMASGPEAAFARAGPVFDAVARKVWRLGDAPGIGSTVKMVNQLLAGVHIAAAAEALALGIRAGVDPALLHEVICTAAGNSWMWGDRVPHILAGDDTPRSAVDIFVKDLGIVLESGRALTFPLPLTAAAHQLFLAVSAAGHGGRDDAFVIR